MVRLIIKRLVSLGVVFILSFIAQAVLFSPKLYAAETTIVDYNFDSSNANDSSGNGNNGTVVGNVTFVSGYSGNAASFNGGYITMPDSIVSGSTTFTISMRIKTGTAAGAVLIGYQIDTPTTTPISGGYIPILYIKKDGRLVGCLWAGGDVSVTTASSINDNNWHKIDFYATPTSITLYVDNSYIGGSTGTVNHFGMTKNQLGTGVDSALANRITGIDGWVSYNGLMDDFVFKRGTTISPATIVTNDASSVSATSSTLNGNITANGGSDVTDRGFVYSSTNTMPAISGSGVSQVSSGSGTGIYNITQPSLVSSTTYYYQAYATNSVGTSYGGVKSFTTSALSSYTVTYHSNGATQGTEPGQQSKTHDVLLVLALNTGSLARTGYVFSGWNTAADSTGTSYAEGENYTVNSSIVLYAKWTVAGSEPIVTITPNNQVNTQILNPEQEEPEIPIDEKLLEEYGNTQDEFIRFLYNRILAREPEEAGKNIWNSRLEDKSYYANNTVKEFISSKEADEHLSELTDADFICFLYKALLNRSPEEYGYNEWILRMSRGMTREQVVDGFLESEEFMFICKKFGVI